MNKKVICLVMTLLMGISVFSANIFAASEPVRDSGIVITPSGGKEIELRGHIEPTIISVTMPSYIPFDISKSVATQNKVVSPRIDVTNNSGVSVSVKVDSTRVNLSELPGVTWNSKGNVSPEQIAVGLTAQDTAPTTLQNANWLAEGRQDLKLLQMSPGGKGTLYVVGAIGNNVPESVTFSITPTLVVRQSP